MIAAVMTELEVRFARLLAVFVALAVGFTAGACALALRDDPGRRGFLPRKVRHGRPRMIVSVGYIDEMVGVDPDLEEVGKTTIGTSEQAAGRDLSRVVRVVGSLAEREHRRGRMAVDTLRHEDVPVGGSCRHGV